MNRKPKSTSRSVKVAVPPPAAKREAGEQRWMEECAKIVADWDSVPEVSKRQIAGLLRDHLESPASARFEKFETPDGKESIRPHGGSDELVNWLRLHGTFKSNSPDYVNDRLDDLMAHFAASRARGCSDRELNAALAFVHGAQAQDTVQATLAVQMAATHSAAMSALRLLGRADNFMQMEPAGKLANKLLGTYARQAEVLAKLQRGGEQVVKHIHIDNRGGQAVVTEHLVTGGQNGKQTGQPHDQGPLGTALLGEDPSGYGMSVTGLEREEALQAPRRSVARRAEG